MELTTWAQGAMRIARAADSRARLELALSMEDASEEEIVLVTQELWAKVTELRSVLRGQFDVPPEGGPTDPPTDRTS